MPGYEYSINIRWRHHKDDHRKCALTIIYTIVIYNYLIYYSKIQSATKWKEWLHIVINTNNKEIDNAEKTVKNVSSY